MHGTISTCIVSKFAKKLTILGFRPCHRLNDTRALKVPSLSIIPVPLQPFPHLLLRHIVHTNARERLLQHQHIFIDDLDSQLHGQSAEVDDAVLPILGLELFQ